MDRDWRSDRGSAGRWWRTSMRLQTAAAYTVGAGIVLAVVGWFYEGASGPMVGWGLGVVFAGVGMEGLGEYAAWRFRRARKAVLDGA